MRILDSLFTALARSPFRIRSQLGPKEHAYLTDKGLPATLGHAAAFARQRLAPADPVKEGRR